MDYIYIMTQNTERMLHTGNLSTFLSHVRTESKENKAGSSGINLNAKKLIREGNKRQGNHLQRVRMSGEDFLYNLRNNFYIGNYQAAINEADSIQDSEEKSLFVYRCYIGLGNYELVQDEIQNDSSPSLLALKYFAMYLQDRSSYESILEKLGNLSQTELTAIVTSLVHYYENRIDEGLRAVASLTTIESMSLMVHGLLMLNRVDKASDIYKRMQQQDEDHTVTALTGTWITIAKVRTAFS